MEAEGGVVGGVVKETRKRVAGCSRTLVRLWRGDGLLELWGSGCYWQMWRM